jgi:hypothetical protein
MYARPWLSHSRLLRSLLALSLLLNMFAGAFAVPSTAHADDTATAAPGDELWDDRFGIPGVEDGDVTTVAIAANGDVYIGGRFTEAGNIKVNHIARWDGARFHPLGEGLDDDPDAIAIAGNKVYAVGSFSSAGNVSANGIAVWDGAEWAAVGSGEGATDQYGNRGWLHAAAIYDGKLVIGGQFLQVDGVEAANVAAWNGNTWSALDRGVGEYDWDGNWSGQGEVRALLPVGDVLVAGGSFQLAGDTTVNSLGIWDGAGWSGLGDGLQMREDGRTRLGKVTALAYGGDTLFAGGYFNRAGGNAVNYVAQYTGGAWSALGAGVKIKQWSTDSPVSALAFADGMLYAGGDFEAAGGKAIDLIAGWNGTAWQEIAGGIANEGYDKVYALAAGNGIVVAGGYFRTIETKRVDSVAILSGGEWLALGEGIHTDYGDMPGKSYAMAADPAGNIFVGGQFTRAGGVAAQNLTMWDGYRWHNVGDADSYIAALVVGDGFLYAGGNFTQIGGIAASHIARMNLQTREWSALGSGINGQVNALAYSEGILYAGGAFKSAGSATAEDVAWWDGTAWHSFGSKARIFEVGDRGGEVGTYVNALTVVGDDVFVGGHFQTIQFGTNTQDLSSFVVVHNVVQWNSATDTWAWVGSPAQPGVTSGGYSGFGTDVYALALVGNSLFIGGKFNQAGGTAASGGLARWDWATSEWISIDGSIGGMDGAHVRALAPSGADLLVAGQFTNTGAAQARYVGRFDTTTNKWVGLGSGLRWYNDIYTTAYTVLALPSGVYVAGEFDRAGEKASMGFARWTGALRAPNLTPEQGGTVQADGVKATFPAGALNEPGTGTLAVTAEPAYTLPDGKAGLYGVQVAATTATGKQVAKTAKPYTVQAPYTDAMLAAAGIADPATLQLMVWTGTAWQPTAGAVDTGSKVVTGATDLLQPLALMGTKTGGGGQDGGEKLFLPSLMR